jgi:hypothetical protein
VIWTDERWKKPVISSTSHQWKWWRRKSGLSAEATQNKGAAASGEEGGGGISIGIQARARSVYTMMIRLSSLLRTKRTETQVFVGVGFFSAQRPGWVESGSSLTCPTYMDGWVSCKPRFFQSLERECGLGNPMPGLEQDNKLAQFPRNAFSILGPFASRKFNKSTIRLSTTETGPLSSSFSQSGVRVQCNSSSM